MNLPTPEKILRALMSGEKEDHCFLMIYPDVSPGLVASPEDRPVASAARLLDNGTSEGGSVVAADVTDTRICPRL